MLIAIEGIDGSGTTTLVAEVARRLSLAGRSVHKTREPSDGPVGRLLREMLAGQHAPVDEVTFSLLFAADRADHVHREVAPALARGAIVLSDRWYHSSLAYQGSGPTRTWIRELNRSALVPALTLFVEVSADLAAARRAERAGSTEIFDDLETQRRVAANYLEVIDELRVAGERIEVVDGTADATRVADEALARITPLLSGEG
jgi:dTMP kinase